MKGALDRLVMLLSADWFKSHWHNIGISAESSQRERFLLECRYIVRRMMAGQSEYWQISFEAGRVNDTYSHFFRSAEQCEFDQHDLAILRGIADESIFETPGYENAALMLSLTQLFVQDPKFQLANGGELSPLLVEKLGIICDTQVVPDFGDWCLTSQTEWDVALRDLTPDLPDHLADFAELLFNQIDSSRKIWAHITSTVSGNERNLLAKLYSETAEELAGVKLSL